MKIAVEQRAYNLCYVTFGAYRAHGRNQAEAIGHLVAEFPELLGATGIEETNRSEAFRLAQDPEERRLSRWPAREAGR